MAVTANNVTSKPIRRQAMNDAMEPKVQGAILLQSLLRLPQPQNNIVIER